MILGRPFFASARLLIDDEQGNVIIRSNSQYQAYKFTPPKVEDSDDIDYWDVWYRFNELVEKHANLELAHEFVAEEEARENYTTEDYD